MEDAMSMMERDALLQHEFRTLFWKKSETPYERLYEAILARALLDLRDGEWLASTYIDARTRARVERDLAAARAWLEDDDTDWPFSFVNCCEALSIDVGGMRKQVLRKLDEKPVQTGPDERQCKDCKGVFPLTEYPMKSNCPKGRGPRCVPCDRAYQRLNWAERQRRSYERRVAV